MEIPIEMRWALANTKPKTHKMIEGSSWAELNDGICEYGLVVNWAQVELELVNSCWIRFLSRPAINVLHINLLSSSMKSLPTYFSHKKRETKLFLYALL